MPGLPFPCVNTIQPFFGCDVHMSIPPNAPSPAPHGVVWSVGLSQKLNFLGAATSTSKASSPESGQDKPVQSGWGYNVGRTHDSGPHPAHIYPNVLLPLIMIASSSKHEFGSGTVKVPGGHDAAVGVAYAVDIALDCGDPMPCTSSLTLTATNSVRSGFTWRDYCRGVVQIYADTLITMMINKVLGRVGKFFSKMTNRVLLRALSPSSFLAHKFPSFYARSGRSLVTLCRENLAMSNPSESWVQNPGEVVSGLSSPFLGLGAGSPMGTSIGGGVYGNTVGTPIDASINDLFRE